MAYGETKVYYDGSHYIAIPHTERPKRYRPKPVEEEITVVETREEGSETVTATEPENPVVSDETSVAEVITDETDVAEKAVAPPEIGRKTTRKELFNELYKKYIDLPRGERHYKIMEEMEAYFDTVEQLKWYVDLGFERKYRNLVARRIRMVRKARMAQFNYFVTFTYSDEKQTEESFKKGLQTCFRNLVYRNGWKYMGVWERSPEKHRLHFHGLFAVAPENMIGTLNEVTDYNTVTHQMQTILQNDYFAKRFGRNDFKELNPFILGDSIAYLMKYIEKTGEKIVYSKGLYQFFISDIMDEDIVCPTGQEGKKLLLFDDFKCWDEGVYMGRVCPEVIEQMRKSN